MASGETLMVQSNFNTIVIKCNVLLNGMWNVWSLMFDVCILVLYTIKLSMFLCISEYLVYSYVHNNTSKPLEIRFGLLLLHNEFAKPWISSEMMDKSKNFIKQTPQKVGILIQNTISKFSKTKNQTQKRPPKVPKNQKHI